MSEIPKAPAGNLGALASERGVMESVLGVIENVREMEREAARISHEAEVASHLEVEAELTRHFEALAAAERERERENTTAFLKAINENGEAAAAWERLAKRRGWTWYGFTILLIGAMIVALAVGAMVAVLVAA